jgi:hypothetical protein
VRKCVLWQGLLIFGIYFLVEIYRKIKVNFYLLCFNYEQIKITEYKHNEQINNQNIDNSECFGVKFVKI